MQGRSAASLHLIISKVIMVDHCTREGTCIKALNTYEFDSSKKNLCLTNELREQGAIQNQPRQEKPWERQEENNSLTHRMGDVLKSVHNAVSVIIAWVNTPFVAYTWV